MAAQLQSTGLRAFPEAGNYTLAFAEMGPVACYHSYPLPHVLIHPIFDHADTPLFVFEALLTHELCHQVLRNADLPHAHAPAFWRLLKRRVNNELIQRADTWVMHQMGGALKFGWDGRVSVKRTWRRHYLRSRDSLFDYRDRQQRNWSMQASRVFLPERSIGEQRLRIYAACK